VSSGQVAGSLTFRNSQRLTALDATTFQRTTADQLSAYAETSATPGSDTQYDAQKLLNPSGLNLASMATTSEALAIDSRATFTTATMLPLTVGVPAVGTYTLAATALNNLPTTLDALLTDAATGQTVNLRLQPAYAFSVTTAQAATALTGRFTLRFASITPLATAPALAVAEEALYPNPAHNAFTVLVPAVATATSLHADLLNALGQVVRRQDATPTASGTHLNVDAANLTPGIYTLRLQVGSTTLAKRVVLQ
jgi:hypothetical protein